MPTLGQKVGQWRRPCFLESHSLVYRIRTEDFYIDIADDVPTRFDTSRYIPDRPLPVGLNKKVIGLMKDELEGAIMTEFVALRPKLYSYRVIDGIENKKCKGIKKCVIKKTLTFEDYKNCLFNSDTIYRSQIMFRSIKHEILTLEVNKIALNRDDDKRISKRKTGFPHWLTDINLYLGILFWENYHLFDTNFKCLTERIETINPYLIREICVVLVVK